MAASEIVLGAGWPALQRHPEPQGLQCNQQLNVNGDVAHFSWALTDLQVCNPSSREELAKFGEWCVAQLQLGSHTDRNLWEAAPVMAQDAQCRQDKGPTLGTRSLAHLGHPSQHRARMHSAPLQRAGQAPALRDLEA